MIQSGLILIASGAQAQTPWLTTPDETRREAELIKKAGEALENAQKISPRLEIEVAIKAVKRVAGKLVESPGFKKVATDSSNTSAAQDLNNISKDHSEKTNKEIAISTASIDKSETRQEMNADDAYDGIHCRSKGNCWAPKPGYPAKIEGTKYDPKHDPNELAKQQLSIEGMEARNKRRIENFKKTGIFEYDINKIKD